MFRPASSALSLGTTRTSAETSPLSPATRIFLLSIALTAGTFAVPWTTGGVLAAGTMLMALAHLHFFYSYLFTGRTIVTAPVSGRIRWFLLFAAANAAYYAAFMVRLEPHTAGILMMLIFILHHCRDEIAIRREANGPGHRTPLKGRDHLAVLFYASGAGWIYVGIALDPVALSGDAIPPLERGIQATLTAGIPALFLASWLLHLLRPPRAEPTVPARAAAFLFGCAVLAHATGFLPRIQPLHFAIALVGHHGMLWYVLGYRRLRRARPARETAPSPDPLERIRTEPGPFLLSVLLTNTLALWLWSRAVRDGLSPGIENLMLDPRWIGFWAGPHILMGFLPPPRPDAKSRPR